jgi:hypothetical protein
MKRYFISKYSPVFLGALLLVACKTIPEWDKEMTDNPVEDGRCPDLSGRFNYDHLGAKDTSDFGSILSNDLPNNLPADRDAPADYKPGFIKRGAALIPIPRPALGDFFAGHYASPAIYNKIHKGKFDNYPGTIIVTLTRSDQTGRKYHVRVDWDIEGLLGEYDFKFDDLWICSKDKIVRTVKSTLGERPNPDEIDPKDYRRIYLLPNGNIRIDRKHTYIARWDQNHLARYYESRVFAKIP